MDFESVKREEIRRYHMIRKTRERISLKSQMEAQFVFLFSIAKMT